MGREVLSRAVLDRRAPGLPGRARTLLPAGLRQGGFLPAVTTAARTLRLCVTRRLPPDRRTRPGMLPPRRRARALRRSTAAVFCRPAARPSEPLRRHGRPRIIRRKCGGPKAAMEMAAEAGKGAACTAVATKSGVDRSARQRLLRQASAEAARHAAASPYSSSDEVTGSSMPAIIGPTPAPMSRHIARVASACTRCGPG